MIDSVRIATRASLFLLLLGGLVTTAWAQAGLEIMQRQRDLHRANDEEETLTMKLVDKSGATRQRRLLRYTITDAANLSKMLIRFLEPRDVEKTSLLTWEARDGNDDQWFYLPAINKAKRIASAGKKTRFVGSDFTFEDLRSEPVALNRYTVAGSAVLDGQECWVIEAGPATERQAADSGYSKRKLWVVRANHYTVKQEFYDKKGTLEKIRTDRKVANVKGTMWRPGEVEMHDVANGSRTLLLVERRTVETGLKDTLFTEAELTQGGR